MPTSSETTAIVTGAAAGIGRAIAERLARDGHRVAVADKDLAGAEAVATTIEQNGGTASAVEVNVKDKGSILAMVDTVIGWYGQIDVLVSNAGIMDRAPFLEMSEDFWHHVLDTNLTSTFLCGQAVAKQMVAQGSGGRIVNTASNSGIFGGRGRAAYGASKAGIINLTQTMAIELAEHNILVNAVAPGPTLTQVQTSDVLPDSVKGRMPLGRFGRPEEIAAVASFLCSADCSFVTGHTYAADGGFTVSGMLEG
jgi:3-oxoacyl-[acyl-carrier protein] reductase